MNQAQIVIPFDPTKSSTAIAAALREMASKFDGAAAVAAAPTASAGTTKTTAKATKAAAPAEEEESFDLGDDEEEIGMAETDEEETEEEEETHTLDDVKAAFKSYANSKRGSREKAAAILKKFGVKSVNDLKPAQFDKVLAAIN